MSGPVDVRVVLEWVDRQLRAAPHEPFSNDSHGIQMVREARAAVAELIEAARPLTSPAHDGSLMEMLTRGLNAHDAASFREAVANLDAALARATGAAS